MADNRIPAHFLASSKAKPGEDVLIALERVDLVRRYETAVYVTFTSGREHRLTHDAEDAAIATFNTLAKLITAKDAHR